MQNQGYNVLFGHRPIGHTSQVTSAKAQHNNTTFKISNKYSTTQYSKSQINTK
jgi:hypothetical protein